MPLALWHGPSFRSAWTGVSGTHSATRFGLIGLGRRLVKTLCPVPGPDRIRPSARVWNNTPSGQPVGSWMRMRAMSSITCAPISIKRSRSVANSAVIRRNRAAHTAHQPERGSVKNQPHLVGDGAVTRHSI